MKTSEKCSKLKVKVKIQNQICSQFPVDFVTSTEEVLNGKLHFLCSTVRPVTTF